jgi:excisionase family DNA binding protein
MSALTHVSDEAVPLPEVATRPELSRFLNVPEATLAKWAHLGVGPRYRKMGRHVRYMRADVLTWLESLPGSPRS